MRGATVIADIVYKTVSTLGSLRQPAEFTCGDCERWARCGMPSSVDCIFKAEQIARGDWQMKRLTKALSLAMGWPSSLEQSKNKISCGSGNLVAATYSSVHLSSGR